MTGPEGFVSRWLRLKRASAIDRSPAQTTRQEPTPPGTVAPPNPEPTSASSGTQPPLEFDPSSLPELASIDADTIVGGFLQSGVPADLARAALRRAWVTDPRIRDFVGIAESQWDFTNPQTIPGFGPIPGTNSLLVARAMRPFGIDGLAASERDRLEEFSHDATSCEHADDIPDRSTS